MEVLLHYTFEVLLSVNDRQISEMHVIHSDYNWCLDIKPLVPREGGGHFRFWPLY